MKGSVTVSGNENRGSYTSVGLEYIYVDRDVTISAPRRNESGTEDGFSWSETDNAYTLNLKEGWNVIHWREAYSWTENSETVTVSLSAGEPGGLRWICGWIGIGTDTVPDPDEEYDGYSMYITPQISRSSSMPKEERRGRFAR